VVTIVVVANEAKSDRLIRLNGNEPTTVAKFILDTTLDAALSVIRYLQILEGSRAHA
jgi:hypothetical protein